MQQRFGQQGGMNQSPQMGGFNGGMGVGSSPYSPMGGGYGMNGANPQLDGMGAFGGGQGPQMGGFVQTSPMGGMGQPQMEPMPSPQQNQTQTNERDLGGIENLLRSKFYRRGMM